MVDRSCYSAGLASGRSFSLLWLAAVPGVVSRYATIIAFNRATILLGFRIRGIFPGEPAPSFPSAFLRGT